MFHGLRVRMGIVTGRVSSGEDLKCSALMEVAKVVSDAGNGGQVSHAAQRSCMHAAGNERVCVHM